MTYIPQPGEPPRNHRPTPLPPEPPRQGRAPLGYYSTSQLYVLAPATPILALVLAVMNVATGGPIATSIGCLVVAVVVAAVIVWYLRLPVDPRLKQELIDRDGPGRWY